jgi:N-methylhydantoinase A/oxoprolinase/acetone carboxylase beta subunit
MAVLLGVDTGGTYTDAVLLRDEVEVLASAKALTTRQDLAIGVGAAIDAVLAQSGVEPVQIAMAALSTTLATNALVEGQGGRVALVFIGFGQADLARAGLEEALQGDPVIHLAGGHSHAGVESAPFDHAALKAWLAQVAGGVSAFAVSSVFSTRNPAHEIAARDLIRAQTGRPVSCSHELTSKLNGPKRAMTAVLNARLIGMIDHLISATESLLRNRGITAPLMVVRGDGALISSAMARNRPIETILSGPAASIVGARWLTDECDALVSDIGGTTTDVAVLRNGNPMIDPQGARVGGFRTMVEAVAMRTTGLGGDSQVQMATTGLSGALTLGPRRRVPVSLCAHHWPDVVHAALDRQLQSERSGEYDGQFLLPVGGQDHAADGLSGLQIEILERIGTQACEMGAVLRSRRQLSALQSLISRGLVMVSAVTPSDASHVLGRQDTWDAAAAGKAVALFGRQRTGAGTRLCEDVTGMAQRIIDQLTEQTSESLLQAAFAEDTLDFGVPAMELARHVLTRRGLDHHRGIVALDAGLNLPVIGLGASASSYYGAVGKRLGTRMVLPKHADVANAIGAVVGQISMRAHGHVSSLGEGRYRAHFTTGAQDFADLAAAISAMEESLHQRATAEARKAGSIDTRVSLERIVRKSTIEGRELFIEAEMIATASGRPRIAVG